MLRSHFARSCASFSISALAWVALAPPPAAAQTCNCSCDLEIPQHLDVQQVWMNEGGSGPVATVGAGLFNVVNSNAYVSFNPEIIEIFLDGVDCNDNGIDDVLDITNDPSLDLNEDWLIDVCGLLVGDMNCDGFITVGDIAGFVLALTNPAEYLVQYPSCNINAADVNNDGFVTVGDIAPFAVLLTGG